MKKIYVYPYKNGSRSARLLANALGAKVIKHWPNSKYKSKTNHVVINWGCSSIPREIVIAFNNDAPVDIASNKLSAFGRILENGDVPTVEWTNLIDVAHRWVREGHTVYGRNHLRGHSGSGIIIITQANETDIDNYPIPLYTKGVRGREYRVHVVGGKVVLVQQKKRRNGVADAPSAIKNHHTGWIYAHENITPPPATMNQIAIDAVRTLGLDFGAVDFIVDKVRGPLVLEVNTAPGLEGATTLKAYADVFKEIINAL